MNRRQMIAGGAALPLAGAALALPADAAGPNGTDAAWADYLEARRNYHALIADADRAMMAIPDHLRTPPYVLCNHAGRVPLEPVKVYKVEMVDNWRQLDPEIRHYPTIPEIKAARHAHWDRLSADLAARRAAYDAAHVEYRAATERADRGYQALDEAESAVLDAPTLNLTDVRRKLEVGEDLARDGSGDSRCILAALDGLRRITGAEPLA